MFLFRLILALALALSIGKEVGRHGLQPDSEHLELPATMVAA